MTELDLFLQSDTYKQLINRPDIIAAFVAGSRLLNVDIAASDYDIVFLTTHEHEWLCFQRDLQNYRHLHWCIESTTPDYFPIKNIQVSYGMIINYQIEPNSKHMLYFDETHAEEFYAWKRYTSTVIKQLEQACLNYYYPRIQDVLNRSWKASNRPTSKFIYRVAVLIDLYYNDNIDTEWVIRFRNIPIEDILSDDKLLSEIDKKFLIINN